MKATFRWWSFWSGDTARVVDIIENKDGYWSKRTQKALKEVWREHPKIEVEDA